MAGWVMLMITLIVGFDHQAAVAQQQGGTLRVIDVSEPTTLNPGLTTSFQTLAVTTKIFSGLLEYDWEFNPKPSLAERWSASSDFREFTFHLRRGVTWHDGKPFTSADVKFSFEQVLSRFHPRARSILTALDRIDTPDPHTVKLKMKQPHRALLKLLLASEAPILPKHLYEGTDISKNRHNVEPVGTGPFKFVEWVRGSHIVLAQNTNYWKPGLPRLERVVFQVIPDQATRVAVMERGDADFAPLSAVPLYEADRLSKLPNLAVTTKGYEAFAAVVRLEFNLRRPPFNDVRVRQAIAHALDKDFVRQTIWSGFGKNATGPISSVLRDFYNPNVPNYPLNLKKAEQMLDEAGHPRRSHGTRFTLELTYLPYREEFGRLADYVKAQLAKVGIAVKIHQYDFATWINKVYTQWDFDADVTQLLNFPDPVSGVERGYTTKGTVKGLPWANSMGYSNPVVDDLFARAAVEIDAKKRKDLYFQAQEVLVREVPAVWLVEIPYLTVMNKDLEDVVTSPWGLYDSFDRAYFKRR
jgi:peptide/nickel transport system substrate-binding protein